MKNNVRLLLLGGSALAAGVFLGLHAPWPQDVAYHQFADQRTWLGVPHFANVVSNLPFLLVGLLGVRFVLRKDVVRPDGPFLTAAERWPYLLLFAGVGLTAFGSSVYHLQPSNERLAWDRLPMALAFMALFDAILLERIGVRFGLLLLAPLVVLGVGSVWYWAQSDDLRPYYLVQFYPMVAIPLLLVLYPPRYTGTGYLFAALGCYVLAKVCEQPLDAPIFGAVGGTVSGHTLKHLLAGLGAYMLLVMVQRRKASGGRQPAVFP